MPLPATVSSTDTFNTWLVATNAIKDHVANGNAIVLVGGTASGDINVNGTSNLKTLYVNTATTLAGANAIISATQIDISGNVSITANVSLSGATLILAGGGGVTLGSNVDMTGLQTNVTGTFRVGGATTLVGDVGTSANVSVGGNLAVTGASTNVAGLRVRSAANLEGVLTVTNAVSVSGNTSLAVLSTNNTTTLGGPMGYSSGAILNINISGSPGATFADFSTGNTGANSATIYRINAQATGLVLTGFHAGANTSMYRQVTVFNVNGYDLTLNHEDGTNTNATNRFYCPGNTNFTLQKHGAATLIYDATLTRWKVSGGGGGTAALLTGNTVTTNSTALAVGANVVLDTSSLFVGNSTANLSSSSLKIYLANSTASLNAVPGKITFDGTVTINATSYGGTANNSTNVAGKSEGNLNVNSAVTCTGSAAQLNSKTEANLNVNSAAYLGSNLPAYYTNASNMNAGTLAAARYASASASANGAVDTTTQTFAGNKTFNGTVNAASNFGVSGNSVFSGTISVKTALENAVIAGAQTGATPTINAVTESVKVWTGADQAIAPSVTGSIDSWMATGQAVTVVFMVGGGGTWAINDSLQVQGVSQQTFWSSGTNGARYTSSGNYTIITYTILKTGSGTFQVFAAYTVYVD